MKTAIITEKEHVQVDPQLLFQRLNVVAEDERQRDPAALFEFEICSPPPVLFDSCGLPRPANKPVLADALWDLVKHDETDPTGDTHYVLHGGAILQRVPWPRGLSFDDICQL